MLHRSSDLGCSDKKQRKNPDARSRAVALNSDSKGFSRRPEGIALWTMILLSFAFLTYSYAIAQIVDWLLVFVLIITTLIFRLAWVVYAWHKPLSVPVEKVERTSFWMTSILSLSLLVSQYSTAGLFDYYLFYIFIAGLLAYYVIAVTRK